MSTIAIALDLTGRRLPERTLRRVLDAQHERGPDGNGFWVDGPIGLGQQTLALLPEDVGTSPPLTVRGLVGVFDGRLDNRDELLSDLAAGRSPASITDCELVLLSYDRWGRDFPAHLDGDFGIAVSDAQRSRLVCARDRFGVRPIFLASHGGVLVVATDVRGVLAHPTLVTEPDEAHVAEQLHYTLSTRVASLYRGVSRLPPAHCLVASNGVVETHKYWDVDLRSSLNPMGEAEYVEEFRELFANAVRAQLRGVAATTVALSGGLDSSLVVAVAAREARSGRGSAANHLPKAASLVFDDLACDESEWIELAASSSGIPSRRIKWIPTEWDAVLEEAARVRYLPPSPNSTFDMFVRDGMRRSTILTGNGGDEWMFGSNAHFLDLWSARRYGGLLANVAHGGGPRLAAATLRSLAARLGQRVPRPRRNRDPSWFGPVLLNMHQDHERLRPPIAAGVPRARSRLYDGIYGTWNVHALERNDQVLSTGHLNAAHPFYDRNVVEFVFALPESERWRGSDSRWFERKVMDGLVPEEIVSRRTKADFSAAYPVQLRALPLERILRTLRVVRLGWVSETVTDLTRFRAMNVYDQWIVLAMEAWSRSL